MCILSRCAPPLRSAPCRSAPTASRLLCVLAALLAALASPVVQSQDFKKEVIDVPDPETLFRRLASVPGYDTPARQRDVAQEMNLLLGRMVNEEHLREGFGQPLRFSTDQRERLRQLALAYSGEVLRLNEQL
ncbi:MAG TPA: hypothetical protein VK116_12960, partial [Planctomycetota bacterium]|nr:hypothetical protein [Planctomycetota bacterium]